MNVVTFGPIKINNCARCGQDHLDLEFKEFKNPIEDKDSTIWNYWAMCPETNEPILMRVVTDKQGHYV